MGGIHFFGIPFSSGFLQVPSHWAACSDFYPSAFMGRRKSFFLFFMLPFIFWVWEEMALVCFHILFSIALLFSYYYSNVFDGLELRKRKTITYTPARSYMFQ